MRQITRKKNFKYDREGEREKKKKKATEKSRRTKGYGGMREGGVRSERESEEAAKRQLWLVNHLQPI